jgi:hypothetical protein
VDPANVTFVLFTAFSSLRIISYLPQIRRIAIDGNGATAISYSTWGLWTGANVATALYAAINLHDLYLSAMSTIYAACCIIVILITMMQRRRLRARSSSIGKLAPCVADSDDNAERSAAVEALRATVREAADAMAANRRPHYTFEQDLAAEARQLVWHDLGRALSAPRVSASRRRQHCRRVI